MAKIFENVSQFETYKPEWIDLTQIEASSQPWFWEGFIPSSTLTLFAGKGGIGKSLLLLTLAANTSSGASFFAGGITHQLPHGSVILLSAEDDVKYQIKPKLMAATADLKKIHFIKSMYGTVSKKYKFVELDKDIHHLEEKIQALQDVKLIIVDPITYFIGEVRDNYNNDVANFLHNLIMLAAKYEIAIVLNKHLRKSSSGSKGASVAADEIGGAGAWTNTPRKSWLITDYHENSKIKIISDIKSNLTEKSNTCLAFKILPYTVTEHMKPVISTTVLEWMPELITMTADEAVNKENFVKGKVEQAVDFILKYLTENGQSLLSTIKSTMLKQGVSEATFRRSLAEFEQRYAKYLIISKGVRGAKMFMLKEDF